MAFFLSPAKVNLRLNVLGRRPDGYHEIVSLMQMIDLCDEIEVSMKGSGVEVFCDSSDVPDGEGNLAFRAAQAFLEATGQRRGVKVAIKKRIPVGAGLGGGSSNAAVVLLALKRLIKVKASRRLLFQLARGLGADVPFFLFGHCALSRGIGDKLEKARIPYPLWFVLVYPGISVSTRWAYEQLDILRALTHPRIETTIKKTSFRCLEELVRFLHNDFEEVIIGAYPEIDVARKELIANGAKGVLMSGSGPTVFGLFEDEKGAKAASKKVKRKGWKVFCARGIEGNWGVDKR